MNRLITVTITSIVILLSMAFTTPSKADDCFMILATSLCEYTKANNRNEIRKRVRKSGLKLRKIYDDITCNGQTLHEFATANNAMDVVAYYEKKIKKLRS